MNPLFYIKDARCISPQQTIENIDFDSVNIFYNNKLIAKESENKNIPLSILRRI